MAKSREESMAEFDNMKKIEGYHYFLVYHPKEDKWDIHLSNDSPRVYFRVFLEDGGKKPEYLGLFKNGKLKSSPRFSAYMEKTIKERGL